MTKRICFDTNVLWDLCSAEERHVEAGLKNSVKAFSDFMIALSDKGLVQISAPWFSVLEFRDRLRDDVYCKYLMVKKGRSPMELKGHRSDYKDMPTEERQHAENKANSAIDNFRWISFVDDLRDPGRFHQRVSNLISRGVVSLYDGCVVASAMDCGVDVFISRDGIFGNQDVQENLRDVLESPTLKFFNHSKFQPLSSEYTDDGRQQDPTGVPSSLDPRETQREQKRKKERNGRRECVSRLFGDAIEALEKRKLGEVVGFSRDHKALGPGSHLIKYHHDSKEHSISAGARVALIGESYCRKLIVRSIQQHNVVLSEPTARKPKERPLQIGLAVEVDNDSFLDPEVREGVLIYLEPDNAALLS